MKLSLCNEVIRELSFERQCALAAGLGYRGLELAPFTFGDDAWRMPAAKRADIRRACSDTGLEVSGLHWLLAAPAGLSITSADRTVWQRSVEVLRASVELCAELGGAYLVHGSPAQRRVSSPDDASRAEEAWILAAEQAAMSKVAYCIEPLARPDCNFVNTLAEAAEIARRIGNPALRIMVDTLAAGLMEPEPVADALRRWMPSGLVAHVQFNDRNRRGPGQGDDRFAPIVRALRETGYAGWIAMEPFVYEPDGPTCAARMIGYVAGLLEPTCMKVKLEEVERYERHVKMRLAFRFGVITVTDATQAVIRARISLSDGRTSHGVAAEALAAKWFEKSPEFTDEQNLDQLRLSLDLAIELYRAQGFEKPFDLFAGTYAEQQKRGAALGLNPLVAAYGPALLDRAILDALGQATGQSFATMITHNVPGIRATSLTPDIEEKEIAPFLARLTAGKSIEVRHTVGLVDPLTAADRPASERVNDGLPETLEEVVSYYRGRYYKLKVGGDIKADLERLGRIAAVLDAGAGDYRATLDGNEQYETVDGIVELWRKVEETPGLAKLAKATLFIEQPLKRTVALSRSVGPLARHRAVIIDESDSDLSSFPSALRLGYTGVSSKNCKGFYKSILNAVRIASLGPGYFMSAEDLTTWPGVSVQQDLALVSLLGLTHVERNAHHFIDGMSFAPEAEQLAFAAGHPDLYEKKNGKPARLKAIGGKLALGSLDVPGFAVGAAMDFKSMVPMKGAST